mgnify:FL=1
MSILFKIFLKGSNLAVNAGVGASSKAVAKRLELALDKNGILLEDTELGECSPSFAGAIVVYAANDGWREWRDSKGNMIETYRDKLSEENDK